MPVYRSSHNRATLKQAAKAQAIGVLAGAGKTSLDLLRELVADEDNWKYYSEILVTMALAGGPEVGPELNTMLEKEVAFWKKRRRDCRATGLPVPDHLRVAT